MIPSTGTPVWIRTAETLWNWEPCLVLFDDMESGGRPAFNVDAYPGVFVDAHEGEFWTTKPTTTERGGEKR